MLTAQWEKIDWQSLSEAGWIHLAQTARHQRVAPLLYYQLRGANPPPIIPQIVLHALQQAYHETAARNVLLYGELQRVLKALNHVLPTYSTTPPQIVVLKGAALANTVYPNMALRPMVDVDVLIPLPYVKAARQAIETMGYRLFEPELSPAISMLHLHWFTFCHPHDPQLQIDLHWQLIARDHEWFAPSLDWFWSHSECWTVPYGAQSEDCRQPPTSTARWLKPGAHLLYLAAHLAIRHTAEEPRLLWYYDIHLLITGYGPSIDWPDLVHRAREFHWIAALAVALQETQRHFGTPMPPQVMQELQCIDDPHAYTLVRHSKDVPQTRSMSVWKELLSMTTRARFQFIYAHILPTRDYLRWRYPLNLPGWLWPLYYPYRWYDLTSDATQTITALIRRKLKKQQ